MTYIKTTWTNDGVPPLSASNLNYVEDGIEAVDIALGSSNAVLSTAVGYASTFSGQLNANASSLASIISVVGSANAALATVDASLSTQIAINVGQAADISANSAAVATLLPQVADHSSSIGYLSATQADHTTTITALGATQAAHTADIIAFAATQGDITSQLTDITATQGAYTATVSAQATAIEDLAEQVADFTGGVVVDAIIENFNSVHYGPLDLMNSISGGGNITASAGLEAAKYIKFHPMATIGLASGLRTFRFALHANQGDTLGNVSAAVLNASGAVIAAITATNMPTVATAIVATWINLPFPSNAYVLSPATSYYLAVAADEIHTVIGGAGANTVEAYHILQSEELLYEYLLPSGINLASYDSLPINAASTVDNAAAGALALFVDEV